MNSEAWGKNREYIEQQSLLAIASYILMRLFIDKKSADLGITDGDTTQKLKYHAKVLSYIKDRIGIGSRVYYSVLSKVTCQMWRFLKTVLPMKSSPVFCENQFRPLLERYL